VIKLSKTFYISEVKKQKISVVRQILGAIRIMHVMPVLAVTSIIAVLTYFSLGGFSPPGAFVLMVLTIFFQEAFIGGQNDYLDHEMDQLFGKKKALPAGWIDKEVAFWVIIGNYFAFTGLSVGLGFYANIGHWVILYIQAANIICMIYNFIAKDTPYSLLPFLIGFPMAPGLVWLCFGKPTLIQLWYIPMILLISLSGHIANELPDYENDKANGNRNFIIFIGKKAATIIYTITAVLSEALLIIPFYVHKLKRNVFLIAMVISSFIGLISFLVLWRQKWKTTELIFMFFTAFYGTNSISLIFLLNT
jgi:4-hydroxybenzoate polyprenyltransferase